MADDSAPVFSVGPLDGQLTAKFLNLVSAAVQDYLRTHLTGPSAPSVDTQGPERRTFIYNGSGSNIVERGVIGIGDPVTLPEKNENEFLLHDIFTSAAPTAAGMFAVALEGIPAGAIGEVQVAGLCKVRVSVSDATHKYAQPIPGDYGKLESCGAAARGAEILWRDDVPVAGVEGDLLSGIVAPGGGDGSNGDYYKDTVGDKWYGPKASGAWPAGQDFETGVVWAAVMLAGPGPDGPMWSTTQDGWLNTVAQIGAGLKTNTSGWQAWNTMNLYSTMIPGEVDFVAGIPSAFATTVGFVGINQPSFIITSYWSGAGQVGIWGMGGPGVTLAVESQGDAAELFLSAGGLAAIQATTVDSVTGNVKVSPSAYGVVAPDSMAWPTLNDGRPQTGTPGLPGTAGVVVGDTGTILPGSTIYVIGGLVGGVTAPSPPIPGILAVNPSNAPLAQNATTLVINGSGFNATFASNTLTWSGAASAPSIASGVVSGGGTIMTLTLTPSFSTLGILQLVVVNGALSSAPAVTVAVVVPAPTLDVNTQAISTTTTSFPIAGTGFASGMTIVFTSGSPVVANVTYISSTSATVNVTTAPTASGITYSLTANVTANGGVTSTVEVASVATTAAAPIVSPTPSNTLLATATTVYVYGANLPTPAHASVTLTGGATVSSISGASTSSVLICTVTGLVVGPLGAIVADTSTGLDSGTSKVVATVTSTGAPVITSNTAIYAQNGSGLIYNGYDLVINATGIDPTTMPTVTPSSGTLSVISWTATSITVRFSVAPSTGSLTATVTSYSVTSASAQIANIEAVTITLNTANMPTTAATLTIAGTAFNPASPSYPNNQCLADQGGTPVQAAPVYVVPAGTSGNVLVTGVGLSAGALYATWYTYGGSSARVQVATVTAAVAWTVEGGTIDAHSSGTFSTTGTDTGATGSSLVYYSGTLSGATAYKDIGTTANTCSVTFVYDATENGGSMASGGAAIGLRWNHSAQEGVFATIINNGMNPEIIIKEMSAGWVGVQLSTNNLALTNGNSYTLTIVDTGTGVTASLTDDSGLQSVNISTTLNAGNTQVMFGWMRLGSTSFVFSATVITGVTT